MSSSGGAVTPRSVTPERDFRCLMSLTPVLLKAAPTGPVRAECVAHTMTVGADTAILSGGCFHGITPIAESKVASNARHEVAIVLLITESSSVTATRRAGSGTERFRDSGSMLTARVAAGSGSARGQPMAMGDSVVDTHIELSGRCCTGQSRTACLSAITATTHRV